jgi:hypothetical protein
MDELQSLQTEYESEYHYIIQGAIIRSRATGHEQGEKNTKYFLNLENYRREKECQTTTDHKVIQDNLHAFYEDLYKEKNHKDIDILSDPF